MFLTKFISQQSFVLLYRISLNTENHGNVSRNDFILVTESAEEGVKICIQDGYIYNSSLFNESNDNDGSSDEVDSDVLPFDYDLPSLSTTEITKPISEASIPSTRAKSATLSKRDSGKEEKKRFILEDIHEDIKKFCLCLDNCNISDLLCPSNVGKNMIEFNVNDLRSVFERIAQKGCFDKTTLFLDVGCGLGLPQLILWHLLKIPSHGVDISPFYTKVAVESLMLVRKQYPDENVKVSFSCKDLNDLKSLNPYQFICCSCTGYVYECIR